MKLSTRLNALLLGCAALPLVLGSVLSFGSAKQALTGIINSALATNATTELQALEEFVSDAMVDLHTWADLRIMQDVLIDDEEGELSGELKRLHSRYPYFAELGALNSSGQTVSSSNKSRVQSDLSGHDAFATSSKGGTFRGNVTSAGILERPSLTLAVPIRAAYDNDTIVGVLVGIVDWSQVQSTLADISVAGANQDEEHRLVITADGGNVVLYDSLSRNVGPAPDDVSGLGTASGVREIVVRGKSFVVGTARSAADDILKDLDWQVHAMLANDAAYAPVNQLRDRFLQFGLLAMVGVLTVGILGARRISRPIGMVSDRLRDIASGDGDLTAELQVKGEDEMAVLSASFNEFVRKIREAISRVAISGTELSSSSNRLVGVVDSTQQAMKRQHHETDQAAAAMQQMRMTVQNVAKNARSTEQISSSADTQAASGLSIVTANRDSTQALVEAMEGAESIVRSLEEESGQIGKTIALISELAYQSNMLALNASIEAKNAGEHGRGFSVVATEVRNLSNRTKDATDKIGIIMTRLQEQASKAAHALDEGRERAREGLARASEVTDVFQAISRATSDISNMSDEISRSVDEQVSAIEGLSTGIERIKEMSQTTVDNAHETETSSADVRRQVSGLEELVKQFKIHAQA